FSTSAQEAGGFDVLINNAGGGHFGPADHLSPDVLQEQFEMLVFAHVELCRLALESMKPREQGGLIINVTSLAARLPVPYMAAYNAAKAAMASFTMSLQLELADSKIRIVDLQPGDIATNFNDSVRKDGPGAAGAEPRLTRAWNVVDRNMKQAPKPALVAERIAELINDPSPPPRVTVGDAFQAAVAPFIYRLLPQRVRLWGLKRYYGI
ncbi:MAG TPA: SDR family NAD(P)-dependent oxidoreductase, partial [Chthoniobacterales bacterium]|nr:SDR family NAD(P)-dependent oxidoreductase [Chthoniobacterales bacterium]